MNHGIEERKEMNAKVAMRYVLVCGVIFKDGINVLKPMDQEDSIHDEYETLETLGLKGIECTTKGIMGMYHSSYHVEKIRHFVQSAIITNSLEMIGV